MHQLTLDIPRFDRNTTRAIALGGAWFAGVTLGLLAARCYGGPVAALSLLAGGAALSFRSSCMVTVLPLFLSAFAVFLFHRAGAYLACAVRGLSIGFALWSFILAGGFWLGALLLFSGLCSSPVLLWFLWRRLTLGNAAFCMDAVCCLLAAAAVSAVDTWAVAPFLARALSF